MGNRKNCKILTSIEAEIRENGSFSDVSFNFFLSSICLPLCSQLYFSHLSHMTCWQRHGSWLCCNQYWVVGWFLQSAVISWLPVHWAVKRRARRLQFLPVQLSGDVEEICEIGIEGLPDTAAGAKIKQSWHWGRWGVTDWVCRFTQMDSLYDRSFEELGHARCMGENLEWFAALCHLFPSSKSFEFSQLENN